MLISRGHERRSASDTACGRRSRAVVCQTAVTVRGCSVTGCRAALAGRALVPSHTIHCFRWESSRAALGALRCAVVGVSPRWARLRLWCPAALPTLAVRPPVLLVGDSHILHCYRRGACARAWTVVVATRRVVVCSVDVVTSVPGPDGPSCHGRHVRRVCSTPTCIVGSLFRATVACCVGGLACLPRCAVVGFFVT